MKKNYSTNKQWTVQNMTFKFSLRLTKRNAFEIVFTGKKIYCYEFVNIVCKICIYYLFLNYNISDAREIFIFGEKARDLS